jgi:hypothetical protein
MESNLENKTALKKVTFLAQTVNTAPVQHFGRTKDSNFVLESEAS